MTVEKSAGLGSGSMFDAIAGRYDFLNRAMSLGTDVRWRKKMIRALEIPQGGRVLDLATGTADVAILAARAASGTTVVGVDPSAKMLEIGRAKVEKAGLADRVDLIEGIAEQLAFPDASFDRISMAFGIRNVPDRARALSEMARVTVPGGRLAILELTEPRDGLIAPFARFHVHHVIPRLGAVLSGSREYRYLQQSIAAFPPAAEFAKQMTTAGWKVTAVTPLSFGACHLFVAEKGR
ncbi:MAG TPA: bifunctional demethylmenaquinone methyltransferase/2-methoxy-6-polyprenyl-1,4-benzoquinol methylase UbiE [bacterium]|nr:bifunctional demethylmenaquinone methyltransferase/2-methoxy-6-polyprenyl-1,4-benzoquinol methylase UbiE [bacterium]